jgi:glutathione synthase/RimK-type ligase-like ATP-grasp enzyme
VKVFNTLKFALDLEEESPELYYRQKLFGDYDALLPAIERVGGAPVVIKLLEGTQGIGVLLAHTLEMATSIIELLQSQKQNILIQKFVAESKGKDIRAIVIGDLVVAAMRRVTQGIMSPFQLLIKQLI